MVIHRQNCLINTIKINTIALKCHQALKYFATFSLQENNKLEENHTLMTI
jgi:uncharacterized CHY-type Zn-finger protein